MTAAMTPLEARLRLAAIRVELSRRCQSLVTESLRHEPQVAESAANIKALMNECAELQAVVDGAMRK